MYFYNKNILEYAQITRNGTESKIPYIESHSNLMHKPYLVTWSTNWEERGQKCPKTVRIVYGCPLFFKSSRRKGQDFFCTVGEI